MDRVTLAVMAIALAGCAGVRLEPLSAAAPISIAPTSAEPAALEIYNNAMGQAAGKGATGGAVAGALWGLACGPWAPVCAPVAALVLSGVGAAGGTAVGAALGPDTDARQRLAEKLAAFQRSHDAQGDLVAEVTALATRHWKVVQDPAAPAVAVRLDEIALHARQGERMVLGVRATVAVRRVAGQPPGRFDSKTFAYLGPESDIRMWLEGSDEFVADSVRQAMRHLAHDAVVELAR